MIPARFPVTEDDIARVVSKFYARVRVDAGLSVIFDAHVEDWPAHEAKITNFWANAILHDRSYAGNPMQAHMSAGNVQPEHFVCWLNTFDAVLIEELAADVAAQWSALAHRIGQGLRFGLENYAQPADGIPRLRA